MPACIYLLAWHATFEQLWVNYENKSIGQQSWITLGLAFAGNCARIFTTLVRGKFFRTSCCSLFIFCPFISARLRPPCNSFLFSLMAIFLACSTLVRSHPGAGAWGQRFACHVCAWGVTELRSRSAVLALHVMRMVMPPLPRHQRQNLQPNLAYFCGSIGFAVAKRQLTLCSADARVDIGILVKVKVFSFNSTKIG